MRRAIDPFYINKIAELMAYAQMAGSPSKIHSYFRDEPQYTKYPAVRTIKKYMALILHGEFALMEQKKGFVYPLHMGPAENQIPWKLARYVLDCLNFYISIYQTVPCIGLTRRFAQIASVSGLSAGTRNDPRRLIDGHIAFMAEAFWYADIVEAIPSRIRPSTLYEEIVLAIPESDRQSETIKNMGVTPLEIPWEDLGLQKFMPVHLHQNRPLHSFQDSRRKLWSLKS